jgi:DNA-binding transcriptional ArsR family regulator
MPAEPPLKPTLWRTCRVLANRTRLRILGLLVRQSPQSVSAVARCLRLRLPLASQCLRALEARGLLVARRKERRTHYSLANPPTAAPRELIATLRSAFKDDSSPVNSLFRLSTAFTHPRRLEIFRAVRKHPSTLGQIQAATRISLPALSRHLGKLQARGFVECRGRTFVATNPPEAFGRALARLAARAEFHT